jgi:Holliday junction resolvase-like predicted endonuclease
VARDRCSEKFREKLLAHQLQTPFAEVDLLFEETCSRPQTFTNYTLVEVKSWSTRLRGELWGPSVISSRQTERLSRARLYLESQAANRLIRIILAVVDLEPCSSVMSVVMTPGHHQSKESGSRMRSSLISKWEPVIRYFDV